MMDFRAVLFIALYLQSISAQCIRSPQIETSYEAPLIPYPTASLALVPDVFAPLAEYSVAAVPSNSRWSQSMLASLAPLTMSCLTGLGPAALAASNGGSFVTKSFSPFAPIGIFIQSTNYYDGTVSVAGQVPFLGSIALEGALPSAGTGSIVYGCGNGDVFITSEEVMDPYLSYSRSMYDFGLYGYDRPPLGYGYGMRY